jgi:hypothetical protein
MRKNQVSISIQRFGDQVPKGYPESTQKIIVYADSNNLYEALAASYSEVIEELRKYEKVPSFGRVDVTTNANEEDKLFFGAKRDEKSDDKN